MNSHDRVDAADFRPVEFQAGPDEVFDLSGLHEDRQSYSEMLDMPPVWCDARKAMTQRRRLRTMACRRLSVLTPSEIATLLALAVCVEEALRVDLPDPKTSGLPAAQVNPTLLEVARGVVYKIGMEFWAFDSYDEDPYSPRLLGVSTDDLAELIRLSGDHPTGRRLHRAVARDAAYKPQ